MRENLLLEDKEHRQRNRKGPLSDSEIMTISVCYHFGRCSDISVVDSTMIPVCHNLIMNICYALTAYSFFENKPEALPVHVKKTNQLILFLRGTYPELAIIGSRHM